MSPYEQVKRQVLALGRQMLDEEVAKGDWPIEGLLDVEFSSGPLREALPHDFTLNWALEVLADAPHAFTMDLDDVPMFDENSLRGHIRSVLLMVAFKEVRSELEAYARELGFLNEADPKEQQREQERAARGW